MKIINRINRVIVRIEEWILAFSVLAMAATLIANVIGRFAFGKGVYAAEEIGQYCIYAITFIGLSYAVTTGKHINMLGLFDMMPKQIQKADALLISAVTGITMGVLSGISFKYVATLQMMGKVSINLHIPTWIVVAVIGCGFLCACLQYILVFIKNLREKEIYLGLDAPYVPDFRREEAGEKC